MGTLHLLLMGTHIHTRSSLFAGCFDFIVSFLDATTTFVDQLRRTGLSSQFSLFPGSFALTYPTAALCETASIPSQHTRLSGRVFVSVNRLTWASLPTYLDPW